MRPQIACAGHTPVAVAAENAQVIFEQFCAVCPTLYVSGTVLAQELRDVTHKRDPSWLAH